MHQAMSTALKRLSKMGGFSKLAAMFGGGGLGGLGGAGGVPDLGAAGGTLPGLGGGAPFNLPPGFDKFSKK
jgi:signal recognition particle subunit SRP54